MKTIKKYRNFVLGIMDCNIIWISYIIANFTRYDYGIFREKIGELNGNILFVIGIYISIFLVFRLYRSLWEHASIEEFMYAMAACACGGVIVSLISPIFKWGISPSIIILGSLFIFVMAFGMRISFRVYRRFVVSVYSKSRKKTLIIGAGSAGASLAKDMKNYKDSVFTPVGFIDDNALKKGKLIHGVKVLGDRKRIDGIVEELDVEMILIAIPSMEKKEKAELIELCSNTKCPVKHIPSIREIVDGKVSLDNIKDINFEDLLGREEVQLECEGIENYIKNQRVLVTGGGGSIGSELCRQIAKFNPRELIILDIYENNAYEIQNELWDKYSYLKLDVIIASVRDKKRMYEIFREKKPDVVFHAAAHKHVPLMERSPMEAIKNNVFGTMNVVNAAGDVGVKRFVLISTDKAVNPTNIMGATKRICEMIVQAKNKESSTQYVAVRFGNVLGSNGSVIPLFVRQMKDGGPVKVTHKEITRFFMTISEAAQLVLQAGAYAKGGEIFVLDMGKPVKIYDFAKKLVKLMGYEPDIDMPIKITGLRPGEKLYEELLMDEEGLGATPNKKIFIGKQLDVEMKDLEEKLAKLQRVVDLNNIERIIHEVERVVTTYVREVNDEVAASKSNE